MVHRLLCLFLLTAACGGPAVVYESEVMTVVEQPGGRTGVPPRFEEYRADDGRTVLNGNSLMILRFLARTQVLSWAPGPADPRPAHHVVVLGPGRSPADPAVLSAYLDALGADLVRRPTPDSTTNGVQLRLRSEK